MPTRRRPRRRGEMDTEHERFMRIALEEARAGRAEGNMAVGGVIVREGEVLARGHDEAVSTFDVTAHAETVALRRLSTRLRVVNPRTARAKARSPTACSTRRSSRARCAASPSA